MYNGPMWPFGHTRRVYLDYASAPPVRAEAIEAMRDAEHFYGNPGALHKEGVDAKKKLEEARAQIASSLECKAREVHFCGGLTEANNIAIVGYARMLERLRGTLDGTHWIVSAIEHDSVLWSFAEVERMGGRVSALSPNERGAIGSDALRRALRPETVFVSIGWANNETGVVQQLGKLSQVIRAHQREFNSRIIFHSDAGQAPLYSSSVIESLGVDLLSLGSNKVYGPHGIGALIVRNDITLAALSFGGKQERGLHAGTENVALASGFGAALRASVREREQEAKRLRALRDQFAKDLEKLPGLVINGDLGSSLPHMLSVSIPAIQSEYVTLSLDAAGIAISTKSACREGEESRSHVVEAMFPGEADRWRAENCLRFSLGRETTQADVQKVAKELGAIVKRQRSVFRPESG